MFYFNCGEKRNHFKVRMFNFNIPTSLIWRVCQCLSTTKYHYNRRVFIVNVSMCSSFIRDLFCFPFYVYKFQPKSHILWRNTYFFDEFTFKTPGYLKNKILISVSFYNLYQFQPKSHLLWRNPFFLTSSLAKLLYTWNIHCNKSVSFYQKIKICQHNSIRSHLIYDTQMIFVFFIEKLTCKTLKPMDITGKFL